MSPSYRVDDFDIDDIDDLPLGGNPPPRGTLSS
jgi:hypothetical protein